MTAAQRVIDDIDALVDEQLRQEASGYDHNLNQPRCRCGSPEWHGLPNGRCPGSDAEGPIGAGRDWLFESYADRVSGYDNGGWLEPCTNLNATVRERRAYRSTTENLRVEYEAELLDPQLDAYLIYRGEPERRQRYSITCLDCNRTGRLTPTASGWYTVYDEAFMECAFADGPPCEHWELVTA